MSSKYALLTSSGCHFYLVNDERFVKIMPKRISCVNNTLRRQDLWIQRISAACFHYPRRSITFVPREKIDINTTLKASKFIQPRRNNQRCTIKRRVLLLLSVQNIRLHWMYRLSVLNRRWTDTRGGRSGVWGTKIHWAADPRGAECIESVNQETVEKIGKSAILQLYTTIVGSGALVFALVMCRFVDRLASQITPVVQHGEDEPYLSSSQ